MNARHRVLIVAPALLTIGLVAPEIRSQSFTGLGFLPGGMQSTASRVCGDGSVVVGSSGGNRAFLWTRAGGMIDLGTLGGTMAYASDVSDDGSVVVGMGDSPAGPRAFLWTYASRMVDLGLPSDGGGDQQATDTYSMAVSGDGAVVAGFSGPINDAFRWTVADGMLSLGTLGAGYSIARDCNTDGTVVVGESTGAADDHAFRWTPATGLQDLGTMPGGTSSHATGVSADGSTVVGYGRTSGFTAIRAFRWTAASGMVSLGTLPGMASRAYAVSGDGSVVVGVLMSPDHAMLWTPLLGMVDLNTYLPSIGLNLTAWTLTSANGVSLDGRTIVGTGTHNGQTEAWVAQWPSSRALPVPPRRRGTRARPVVPEGGTPTVRPM
jgi:probable HAF family extracellular repeat protein